MSYTDQEKMQEFERLKDFLESLDLAAEILPKGNVLDAMREHQVEAEVIMACGPMPMLRAIGSPTSFRLPRKRSWSAAYRIRNCSYGPAPRAARR